MPVSRVVALSFVMATLLVAGCTEPVTRENIMNSPSIITTPSTMSASDLSVNRTQVAPRCPPKDSVPNSIISGDSFFFRSRVPNANASDIRVWILGPKKAMMFGPHSVPGDNNNLTISGEATHNLDNGTYQVLFQYADASGEFNAGMKNPRYPDWVLNRNGDLILDIDNVRKGGMTGADAANILEKEINSAGNGPKAERTTMNVTSAWIHINPIGNHTIGDKFAITGTTNLAEGQEVAFDIMPVIDRRSEFEKDWAMTHYIPNTQRVKSGLCGVNTWSYDIDSRAISPVEYYIAVTAIRQDAYATTQFFMLSPSDSPTAPAATNTA
jgi:hypothetical protein